MSWLAHAWWWIEVHTGTVNEPGPYYGFFSGFGSDIAELTLVGGAIALYKGHTCHVDRCWRLKRHRVDGTPYEVCRKHHPAVPDQVTAGHIRQAHRSAHD
jgi:hypothetical protein